MSTRTTPYRVQLLGLAGWLLLTFAAAATGALAAAEAGPFYQQLARPDWSPPAWVFAPVWSALYVLIGIAAWLVWRAHGFRGARAALTLYIVQLAANALWTWLFFAWRQGALAFAEAIVLWCLIVGTAVSFSRLHRLAAALLLPYLGWVSFAVVLTFSTWQRNPGVLG
ncbi:MAG: tryptophan-rich sensory protein [Rhodocyclaceae bacterium]|nr:tryptophan-rich sensory protein [Rhodocyclaceae bacterium]